MAEMRPIAKDLYHVGMAIVLVLAILGLLTWSGIISCRDVPGFCSVYYAIKGPPKTLIVFGENGLGDPALLGQELRNRSGAAATNISQQAVEFVSAGNLKQFDLVIVTRARDGRDALADTSQLRLPIGSCRQLVFLQDVLVRIVAQFALLRVRNDDELRSARFTDGLTGKDQKTSDGQARDF